MKTQIRHILLFTFFVCTSTLIFCQQTKLDKTIMIGGFQTTIFYSDHFNLLAVSSQKDSIEKLVIKSSQGNLQNVDSGIVNGFLNLTDLKNGKVTISVFRHADTGLQLLNYKTFNVVTRPLTKEEKEVLKLSIKPEISIEGYSKGKIPLQIIRQATKFNINKPYKITSLTIYVGSNKGICSMPMISQLNSANFDDNFKNIWKRISEGSYINLEDIKITDSKGKVYTLNPIGFLVDK